MKQHLTCDQIEYQICNGKTFPEAYPNMYLAIDIERVAILAKANDEEVFIAELLKIPSHVYLRIVSPWECRAACPSVFPMESSDEN